MEFVSIRNLPKTAKIQLLKELGYNSDGEYVLYRNEKVRDRYINKEVKVSNMAIVPGSTIVLDDNPVSIASYLEEYNAD